MSDKERLFEASEGHCGDHDRAPLTRDERKYGKHGADRQSLWTGVLEYGNLRITFVGSLRQATST